MKYYLGIDGGGTKTKFVVGGKDGRITGEYTGSPCHYMQCGFDGLENLIRQGISAACIDAGIKPSDIAFAFAGCAGFGDLAADQPSINNALKSAFGDIPFAAGNDSENALAGALDGEPGINIIAGTGSIGSGRNESGEFMRCGGWHYALGGDEGSGYWIGWSLLKNYARQSDGRDEKTFLYDAINRELNLKSDDEMVTRVVNEWKLDRTRIASLAPLCGVLANQGDICAMGILKECAKELSDLAIALYDKLGFAHSSLAQRSGESSRGYSNNVPVSGTGGIFKIGPWITQPFADILSQHNMEYVEPKYSPDKGALLLAINYGTQK